MLSLDAAKIIAKSKAKESKLSCVCENEDLFIMFYNDGDGVAPGGAFQVSVNKNNGECNFFNYLSPEGYKICKKA